MWCRNRSYVLWLDGLCFFIRSLLWFGNIVDFVQRNAYTFLVFFIFLALMYSEADTRSKFIDPKLYAQGWKEEYIVRECFFVASCRFSGLRTLGAKNQIFVLLSILEKCIILSRNLQWKCYNFVYSFLQNDFMNAYEVSMR